MAKRYYRNSNVAVLFSPGFGGGWSTWNPEFSSEELIFDDTLVEMIVHGDSIDKIESYVQDKWGPDIYLGGLGDLTICWVPEHSEFRIEEYDGSESVILKDQYTWITA